MEKNRFEELKKIAEGIISVERKDKKVAKTIKMKPEWIKLNQELDELAKQASEIHGEMKSKRNLMWGMIETELGIYNEDMHIDDERMVIEVYE